MAESSASRAPLRVLGVNGSLHEKGITLAVLEHFLHLVGQRGGEPLLLDLREVQLPLYAPDREGHAAAQQRVAADMNWAQAIVLASPDYHGSMSGAMKNFLDYSWSECAGKLFAYICTSHEKGLTVMEQMRTVVRQCYGWSLPYGVSFDPTSDADTEKNIFAQRVEQRLRMMARDLVSYGTILHAHFVADLASEEADTFAAVYRKVVR